MADRRGVPLRTEQDVVSAVDVSELAEAVRDLAWAVDRLHPGRTPQVADGIEEVVDRIHAATGVDVERIEPPGRYGR